MKKDWHRMQSLKARVPLEEVFAADISAEMWCPQDIRTSPLLEDKTVWKG